MSWQIEYTAGEDGWGPIIHEQMFWEIDLAPMDVMVVVDYLLHKFEPWTPVGAN